MGSDKDKARHYRRLFIVFLLVFAYLSFKIISPLWESIVLGAIMAYIFSPLYNKLDERLKRPTASAFVVCTLIMLVSVASVFVVGRALADDAKNIYLSTKQFFSAPSLFGQCDPEQEVQCFLAQTMQAMVSDPDLRGFIDEGAHAIGESVFTRTSQMVYAIPDFIAFVAVSFFVSFYLFIDGKKLIARIRKSLPIRSSCQRVISERIAALTRSVIFGSVIIAIIQGIFAAIGFLVIGISEPIFWGAITALFALIPYIGTALVWLPASIGLMASGAPIKGVILLAYGALVISMIDNLLRPLVIGNSADIHPLMAFLGVFGGVALLGPLGFIVGPVILAVFEALLEIYETERGELT